VLITVEGQHDEAEDDVGQATDDLLALLGEYRADAQMASALLGPGSTSFGL
jgi:hypothetical protein